MLQMFDVVFFVFPTQSSRFVGSHRKIEKYERNGLETKSCVRKKYG